MDPQSQSSYLESQVRTATPQKLRLMLIDGAIRFARQALDQWEPEQTPEVATLLSRCRRILHELTASVRSDASELAGQVASVYLFLYRTIIEAQTQHDAAKVESVLRVLVEEQKTWSQVCETMPHAPERPAGPPPGTCEVSAADIPSIPVDPETTLGDGLSLEA